MVPSNDATFPAVSVDGVTGGALGEETVELDESELIVPKRL